MHWNVYATDAQSLPHVSALSRCHHQGVFTLVKEELLKWSVVRSTVTRGTLLKFHLKHRRNHP